jgi:voltage-gated potassium channel
VTEQPPYGRRVARWERRAEVPLLLLALAFLVAYAWPILDPSTSRDARALFNSAATAVWVAFAVDFIIRIAIAERRARYIRSRWYDVILVSVPLLRPLRLLRLIALLRLLNRSAVGGLAGRAVTYVTGFAVLAVALSSLAILDAERRATDANITTFGDALWWSATTVTTVGYGDRFPVTSEGRLIAVALMVVGISLIGVITASVAAWFVSRVAASETAEVEKDMDESTDTILASLAELKAQMTALEARLDDRP